MQNNRWHHVVNLCGGRELPPTPGRIFRVAARLAQWTPEELAWLKQNPGVIAYQDQLEATLEDVHRELAGEAPTTDPAEFLPSGSPLVAVYVI
jgi:hypothetical protein